MASSSYLGATIGAATTAPGGAAGDVQYNNSGSLGGFGDWDGSILTVPGNLAVGSGPYATAGAIRLTFNEEIISAGDAGGDVNLLTVVTANLGSAPQDYVKAFNNSDRSVILGTGTFVFNSAPSAPIFLMGSGQSFTDNGGAGESVLIGTNNSAVADDNDVFAFGADNSLFGLNLYTFGDANVMGDVTHSTRTAFSFGESNSIILTGFAHSHAIGRSNTITHANVILVGRGLTETDASQTWFGDAVGTVFISSGNAIDLKPTTDLSINGTPGVTAGPFTTITSIAVTNGLVTTLTGS